MEGAVPAHLRSGRPYQDGGRGAGGACRQGCAGSGRRGRGRDGPLAEALLGAFLGRLLLDFAENPLDRGDADDEVENPLLSHISQYYALAGRFV